MANSITREQVIQAMERKHGGQTFAQTARRMGVSRQALSAAVQRETKGGFQVAPEHVDGCICRDDTVPFVVPAGLDLDLSDPRGRSEGSAHGWYLFRCNDPACDAILRVKVSVLAAFLADGLAARLSSTTKGPGDVAS